MTEQNGPKLYLGSALTAASLFALFWGVVQWGLKLEADKDIQASQITTLTDRVARLESASEPGVLPVAERAIADLERRVEQLERR